MSLNFTKNQQFKLFSTKIVNEFHEAKQAGIITKPVIIGPVSYLLLGKEKEQGFHRIDLLKNLLPVYIDILTRLEKLGVEWIQLDEPYLALDLSQKEREAIVYAYSEIQKQFPKLKIILANYFDCYGDNLETVLSLPVHTVHLDLVRCPSQLDDIIDSTTLSANTHLSLGVVDGRNIWKNDFQNSLALINKVVQKVGHDRVMIAPSCSLIHSPCDLDLETNEQTLSPEIKQWLAFAKQKIDEVVTIKQLASPEENRAALEKLEANQLAIESRKVSKLIHNDKVKERVSAITEADGKRQNIFAIRKEEQHNVLNLPLFPTTTIGSFPQTTEVRTWRSKFKKGEFNEQQYDTLLKEETEKTIRWQEEIGIDVLVHGEFERNDMVEYFGEQLEGVVFTKNGWVQSYGSRCVKPPIIYGDISRPTPMTVYWTEYAQSLTKKTSKRNVDRTRYHFAMELCSQRPATFTNLHSNSVGHS